MKLMKLSYSTRFTLFFSAMIFVGAVILGAGAYVLPHRITKIGEAGLPFGEATQNIQLQIEEQLPAIMPQNTEPAPAVQVIPQDEIIPLEETDEEPMPQEPIVEIPGEAMNDM